MTSDVTTKGGLGDKFENHDPEKQKMNDEHKVRCRSLKLMKKNSMKTLGIREILNPSMARGLQTSRVHNKSEKETRFRLLAICVHHPIVFGLNEASKAVYLGISLFLPRTL